MDCLSSSHWRYSRAVRPNWRLNFKALNLLCPSIPFVIQAILQQAQGDEKQAEALYLKTVGIQPHNVMVRNDLALHLARNGRYSDSVDEFKKAMVCSAFVPQAPFLKMGV